MSPFSAPFFWGTQKRGLLLPKRAAALWEGTQWCKGGTGKAEAAKLQDAGISMGPSDAIDGKSSRLPDPEKETVRGSIISGGDGCRRSSFHGPDRNSERGRTAWRADCAPSAPPGSSPLRRAARSFQPLGPDAFQFCWGDMM